MPFAKVAVPDPPSVPLPPLVALKKPPLEGLVSVRLVVPLLVALFPN